MSRRFARVDFPSKEWLSESEAMDHLRNGPALAWFSSWISTGDLTVTAELLKSWERYELVHLYFDAERGRVVQEPVMYDDAERFRWAVGRLYEAHTQGRAKCCRAGNEHIGAHYFIYPARPYTELERDEGYYSPIGALRFAPRERGLL